MIFFSFFHLFLFFSLSIVYIVFQRRVFNLFSSFKKDDCQCFFGLLCFVDYIFNYMCVCVCELFDMSCVVSCCVQH